MKIRLVFSLVCLVLLSACVGAQDDSVLPLSPIHAWIRAANQWSAIGLDSDVTEEVPPPVDGWMARMLDIAPDEAFWITEDQLSELEAANGRAMVETYVTQERDWFALVAQATAQTPTSDP